MFLWQSQAGSVGRCSVPLLSALSPAQSLWRSPLSLIKALPCVQLHLCSAGHKVQPHSYAAENQNQIICIIPHIWPIKIILILIFNHWIPLYYLLFQISTATWARLHPQTTVWFCGLWRYRCVAVLHSSVQIFDGSFADRGIMSSFNDRYVVFHFYRLQHFFRAYIWNWVQGDFALVSYVSHYSDSIPV